MAEIVVQFSNQRNGYDKAEVNQFVKDAEAKLQEKAMALATTQQQVAELEARISKLTAGDLAVEEKAVLYDKLMIKMDGDYENLLRPAIAKAKAIEEKAQVEYQIRIDQARATAEEICKAAAARIAETVDCNLARTYEQVEALIYSKSLPGRLKALAEDCAYATAKIAEGAIAVGKVSCVACKKVKTTCRDAKESLGSKLHKTMKKQKKNIKTAVNLFR